MSELPIDALREDFEGALDPTRPLVVTAPTGSGKSTRLPLWMAARLDAPVLVVEPRRVACRALADHLSRERGERPGQRVGYRVRFEERAGPDTRVLFATPGVALRLLQSAARGDGWPFGAVMLDEFHERGWEVDLLATLLRAPGAAPGRQPLVFTSATLDAEALVERLDGRLLEARGRAFPVTIEHDDAADAPSDRDLDARVAQAVRRALDEDDGEVLVFLPGKAEIGAAEGALDGLARARGVALVQVHGTLPLSRLSRALTPRADQRRVFLATNVAETSLTLPGVTTVIDSGLARMKIHRAGRSALALVAISQAAMDQRAGRAGRVAPGRCVRLWRASYRPDAVTPPEIARDELDDLVLHAATCGLDGARFDAAPWPTAPPPFALARARARLSDAGALDADGHLTPLGERLGALPVSVHEARLLHAPPPALAGAIADLVALIQRRGSLYLPLMGLGGPERDAALEARQALLGDAAHEVGAELLALRHGDRRRHRLHDSRLREARKIAAQLRALLGVRPSDPTRDAAPLPDAAALAGFIASRVPEAGFVLRPRALRRRDDPGRASRKRSKGPGAEPWTNGEVEVEVWPYTPPAPSPRAEPSAPCAGVLLAHAWIGGRGLRVRGVGHMLLPCSRRCLADAGLGDVVVEAPSLSRAPDGTPRVLGVVTRTLGGVTLDSDTRPLRGAQLREAVADFILEGRLLKGGAEPLRDDLHLWALLHAWPEAASLPADAPPPPETPRAFLIARLRELGLELASDLLLLEPDDLRPDLVTLSGVPGFELERVRDAFPRLWTLLGATYACEIRPHARRVILRPDNAQASRAEPPDARFLPAFRGFAVDYHKASRRVPLRR